MLHHEERLKRKLQQLRGLFVSVSLVHQTRCPQQHWQPHPIHQRVVKQRSDIFAG